MFDKFHSVRHLMDAVAHVRRDEVREQGPAHKALLYKTRFIWLKNPWNFTAHQALRLRALERLNLKINGSVATFGITRESPLGGPRYTANPNTLWISRV